MSAQRGGPAPGTQLLHNRPTCRVCGAKLKGYVDPEDGGMVIAPGVARDIALWVIGLLGAVVVVGGLVLAALFALF